jgi:(p)ppGpp synthase/HD superfamily hydrolase
MPVGNPRLNDAYWQLLHHIGAHQVPHSGRTLLDHLRGTYELLTQWGSKEVTRVAGLFHSIYGTQTFAHALLDRSQRSYVRSTVGATTEHLVFLFSVCDRDSFFENIDTKNISLLNKVDGELVEVTPQTLSALVEIEVANTLEQIPHKKRISLEVMDIYARQCKAAKPVLPDVAFRQCVRVFEHYLPNGGLDHRQP